jgi:hypothetical protein
MQFGIEEQHITDEVQYLRNKKWQNLL